jgi:hypothetical protein
MKLSNKRQAVLNTDESKIPTLARILREEHPNDELFDNINALETSYFTQIVFGEPNLLSQLPVNEIDYLTTVAAYNYPRCIVTGTPKYIADKISEKFSSNFLSIMEFYVNEDNKGWFFDVMLRSERSFLIPKQHIPMFVINILFHYSGQFLPSDLNRVKFLMKEYRTIFSDAQYTKAKELLFNNLTDISTYSEAWDLSKDREVLGEEYTNDRVLDDLLVKYKESLGGVETNTLLLNFAIANKVMHPEKILFALNRCTQMAGYRFIVTYDNLDYITFFKSNFLTKDGVINLALFHTFVSIENEKFSTLFFNALLEELAKLNFTPDILVVKDMLERFSSDKDKIQKILDALKLDLTLVKALWSSILYSFYYAIDKFSTSELSDYINAILDQIMRHTNIMLTDEEYKKILESAQIAEKENYFYKVIRETLKSRDIFSDENTTKSFMQYCKDNDLSAYATLITRRNVALVMGVSKENEKDMYSPVLENINRINTDSLSNFLALMFNKIRAGESNIDLKDAVITYLSRDDAEDKISMSSQFKGIYGAEFNKKMILTIIDNISVSPNSNMNDFIDFLQANNFVPTEDQFYKLLDDYAGQSYGTIYFIKLTTHKEEPIIKLDWSRIFDIYEKYEKGIIATIINSALRCGRQPVYKDLNNDLLQEQYDKYSFDKKFAYVILTGPEGNGNEIRSKDGEFSININKTNLLKSALFDKNFFHSPLWGNYYRKSSGVATLSFEEKNLILKAGIRNHDPIYVLDSWNLDEPEREKLLANLANYSVNFNEYDDREAWFEKSKVVDTINLATKINNLNVPKPESNLYSEDVKNKLFNDEANSIKDIVGENPIDALADLMGGKNTGGLKKIKIVYNAQLKRNTSLHDIAVALQGENFQNATKDKQFGNLVLSYLVRRADYQIFADLVSAAAKIPVYMGQKRASIEADLKQQDKDALIQISGPKELKKLVDEEMKKVKLPSVVELLKVDTNVAVDTADTPLSIHKNTMYKYSESSKESIDEFVERLSRDTAFGDVEMASIKPLQKVYTVDGHKYRLEILRKDDPLGLVLGERLLTSCCQKLGGAGQTAMERGYLSPNHAFSVLYREGDEIPVSQGILYYHTENPTNKLVIVDKDTEKYQELSKLEISPYRAFSTKEYYFDENIDGESVIGWYGLMWNEDKKAILLVKPADNYLLFDSIEFHDMFVKDDDDEDDVQEGQSLAANYLYYKSGKTINTGDLKWQDISLDKTKEQIETAWKLFAKDLRDMYKCRMVSMGTGYTDFNIDGLPETPENRYVNTTGKYQYSDADYSLDSKHTVRLAKKDIVLSIAKEVAAPEVQKFFIGEKKKKKKIELSKN